MNSFVRVAESYFEKGMRVIKYLLAGAETSYQAAPAGVDSAPIADMLAIRAATDTDGDDAIIGYIQKNQVAAPGEIRIFSIDSNGAVQIYLHLKADGTAEFGGATDHMVRYSKLEEAFNELKSDLNNLVDAFNNHMHPTAAVGSPSAPTPVPGSIPAMASNAVITGAKIEEIKTLE